MVLLEMLESSISDDMEVLMAKRHLGTSRIVLNIDNQNQFDQLQCCCCFKYVDE